MMKSAVLIVSWNGAGFLPDCLGSLSVAGGEPEVVVVDNGSDDNSVEVVRAFAAEGRERGGGVSLIRCERNLGFARGANAGFAALLGKASPPDFVLLLNQDATLEAGCLTSLAEAFERDQRVGAVGCKIHFPDGKTIQHAGGFLSRPRLVGLHYGHHEVDDGESFSKEKEVEFVTGAAMALRTACLRQVGLFDELFSPGYYEDVDLCHRLRECGWRVIYSPRALARHAEATSFQNRGDRSCLVNRNRLLFALGWLGEPTFRQQFAEAERAFLREADAEDLRGLAQAYLLAILALGGPAAGRVLGEPRSAERVEDLIELFASLRHECLDSLRRFCAPA